MNSQAKDGFSALTEKEKQTLRLIVRGHDAKSTARSLGLSVHTINERLRDARRKMAVSSSREAARLLLEAEGGPDLPDPDLFGDTIIGEDASTTPTDQIPRRPSRRPWIIGVSTMTFVLGLLALAALPQIASPPAAAPATSDQAPIAEVIDTARRFLTLVDQGRWSDSYQMTGTAFRKLNTAKVWASVSEQVRPPLGAATSRAFVSEENFAAPPNGYEVVKFRTSFANKGETQETVTLEREGGSWRVVAVLIG